VQCAGAGTGVEDFFSWNTKRNTGCGVPAGLWTGVNGAVGQLVLCHLLSSQFLDWWLCVAFVSQDFFLCVRKGRDVSSLVCSRNLDSVKNVGSQRLQCAEVSGESFLSTVVPTKRWPQISVNNAQALTWGQKSTGQFLHHNWTRSNKSY